MIKFIYLLVFSFCCLLTQTQTPIQANSALVEFGQRVITNPSTSTAGSANYVVTLLKLQIPAAEWRKQHVSLASISDFRVNTNSRLQFFCDRLLGIATQFPIKIDSVVTAAGPKNWPASSILKFYYLVLSASLPDVWVSDKLFAINNTGVSFPGTWQKTFAFGQWTGPSPLNLMLSTVKFVHAITYQDIEALNADNRFELKISFTPTNTDRFNLTLNSALSLKINFLNINMFIYDQAAFAANKFYVRHGYQTVPTFGIGNPIVQHFTTGGWPNYPGMHAMIGLAGYEYNGTSFGYDLRLDILTYSTILTVTAQNYFPNTIMIPRIEVSYLSISQLACPSMTPLLDKTQTACLSSCPAGQNPSTSPLPLIGIYRCQPCTGTCCIVGQYLNGICKVCPTDCLVCTSATKCISCASGLTLDSTGACVSGLICTPPCTACDSTGCTSCSTPYIVGLLTACSLVNCAECLSVAVCKTCDSGYIVDKNGACVAVPANPCTTISGCQICAFSICTACKSGYIYDSSLSSCVSLTATAPTCSNNNCALCLTATQCKTCNSGFIVDTTGQCVAVLAAPCPTIAGCSICSAGVCTACQTGYIYDVALSSCVASSPSISTCLCPSGTIFVSGSCISCSTNCVLCSSSSVCQECESQFYVTISNTCAPCPPNCINCDTTGCNQCAPGLTLDSSKNCACPIGSFYKTLTQACDSCTVITGCTECSSSTVCTVCAPGHYISMNICIPCSTPIPNCIECASSTTCNICATGFYVNALNNCESCVTGCSTCTSPTACTLCQASLVLNSGMCVCQNGFYYDTGSSPCLTCTSALTGCSQCSSSTVCSLCMPGFYLPAGGSACQPCSANCLNCDNSGCTTCSAGFFSFTDISVTPSIICKDCKLQFGNECLSCDSTQCTSCSTVSFWWAPSNQCLLLADVVCGDGLWIDIVESCDDGNIFTGDGCNSLCQVETDYVCPLADRLASGASVCKFTKDISVTFNRLQKEVSTNTIQLFLNLEPATFSQWTPEAITSLLSPLEIVNQQTGAVSTIPINGISISFMRNPLNNQVQLTIDYGQNNLEGSELKFNINPGATNLQSLQLLSVKNNLALKIEGKGTGMYLFGYDDSMYSTQSAIGSVSSAIGFLAIFLAFLGLCIPSGKLIIIEALAVIQISYFSVLQFQKIPPTYAGLKNLIISNGYNYQGFFSSLQSSSPQNVYKILGLQPSALSNFNIALIAFIALPVLVGGIGLLVRKFLTKPADESAYEPIQDETTPQIDSPEKESKVLKNESNQLQKESNDPEASVKALKEQNPDERLKISSVTDPYKTVKPENDVKKPNERNYQTQNQTSSLPKLIFERILYENTFYGIFLTSYLAWVSIFNSFSNFGVGSVMVMLTFSGFVFTFVFLFYKAIPQRVPLDSLMSKSPYKTKKHLEESQKKHLLTGFGEFNEICTQSTPNPGDAALKLPSKIALIFLAERLVSGAFVVLISPSVPVLGVFITLIEAGLFVALLMANRMIKRLQKQQLEKAEEEKKKQNEDKIILEVQGKTFQKNPVKEKSSALQFFYQNYIFRQGLNCTTVILIQILYLIANFTMTNQDYFETFVNNSMVTKILPIATLTLLALNLMLNSFLWVNELRFDKIVSKTKLLFEQNFSKAKEPFKRKNDEQSQVNQMEKRYRSRSQNQEDEVVQKLNKFIEVSRNLNNKNSPFLGIQQKEKTQDALLSLLKVEESHKVKMSDRGKDLKNQLIDKFWDEI